MPLAVSERDFIIPWYRYHIKFIDKKCDIVVMAHVTLLLWYKVSFSTDFSTSKNTDIIFQLIQAVKL